MKNLFGLQLWHLFKYAELTEHVRENDKLFIDLQYFLATNSIDVIPGDFNCDLSKMSQNKFLDIFTDHVQMVNKSKHISGSLIDHVYIMRALMKDIFTNVTVKTFILQIMML